MGERKPERVRLRRLVIDLLSPAKYQVILG